MKTAYEIARDIACCCNDDTPFLGMFDDFICSYNGVCCDMHNIAREMIMRGEYYG